MMHLELHDGNIYEVQEGLDANNPFFRMFPYFVEIMPGYFKDNRGGGLNPPFLSAINRRFRTRTGHVLNDEIANKDANVLFPVSSFNGIDSKVTGLPSFTVLNSFVELSFKIDKDSDRLKFNPLLGGTALLYVRENKLIYYVLDSVEIYTICTLPIVYGENYNLRINFNATSVEFILNGVSDIVSITSYRKPTHDIVLGQHASWYLKGSMWNVRFNGSFSIPLPHLGYGFDVNGDAVRLTTSNVEVDYNKGGSTWLLDKGCVRRGNTIIPNKPDKTNALPIVVGDIKISPSPFLNNSSFRLDMKASNPTTDISVYIFDKSRTDIWKDTVRTGENYDSANPYEWDSSELTMKFLYENIQDTYKYQIWNKINQSSGEWKDFFIYDSALTGSDICKAKSYVGVGEIYSLVDSPTLICPIDKIS